MTDLYLPDMPYDPMFIDDVMTIQWQEFFRSIFDKVENPDITILDTLAIDIIAGVYDIPKSYDNELKSLEARTVQLVTVLNIDTPTELALYESTESGGLLIATEEIATANAYTIYTWDSANSAGPTGPYIVAGSSGYWTAVAGKYVAEEGIRRSSLTLLTGVKAAYGSFKESSIEFDGINLLLDEEGVGAKFGDEIKLADSKKLTLGTLDDTSIEYDGTNLLIDEEAIGTKLGGDVAIGNGFGANASLSLRKNNSGNSITLDATSTWTPTNGTAYVGLQFLAYISGSGTPANWTGVSASLSNIFTYIGNLLSLSGFKFRTSYIINSGDTVGTSIGLDLAPAFAIIPGGTFTSNYGIKIGNMTGAVNNWAIYTGTGLIHFGDDVEILSDSKKLLLGANNDVSMGYDGTDAFIDTDEQNDTPTDLVIKCGAAKTLELETVVYEDLQVGMNNITRGVTAPTDRTYAYGVGGGIAYPTLGFAKNDYIWFNVQTRHAMKLNTVLDCHIHFVLPNTTTIGHKFVFQLDVLVAGINGTWAVPAGSPFTATHTVAANDNTSHRVLTLCDIPASNTTISSVYKMKLTRIDGVATEYASEVYLEFVDCHYQINTIGSRQETAK